MLLLLLLYLFSALGALEVGVLCVFTEGAVRLLAARVGPPVAEVAADPLHPVVEVVSVKVDLVAPVAELLLRVDLVALVAKANLLALSQLVLVPALLVLLGQLAEDVEADFPCVPFFGFFRRYFEKF